MISSFSETRHLTDLSEQEKIEQLDIGPKKKRKKLSMSNRTDRNDKRTQNRRKKKCKTALEIAKDTEIVDMQSVQSKAGASGMHASSHLKQQSNRKESCIEKRLKIKRESKRLNVEESKLDNNRTKKLKTSEVYPACGLKSSLHLIAYQTKAVNAFFETWCRSRIPISPGYRNGCSWKIWWFCFPVQTRQKNSTSFSTSQAQVKWVRQHFR